MWTSGTFHVSPLRFLRHSAQAQTQQSASFVPPHPHAHYSQRAPWLRAAVLGAMDGLGSIASLIMGVQGGAASRHSTLLAGISGTVAGALSMGVSEFVSVSCQRDAELADFRAEAKEQERGPAARDAEQAELAKIYEERGLDSTLAARVAAALTAIDPVQAHARDELGLDTRRLANPWKAALAGTLSFLVGASMPLIVAGAVHGKRLVIVWSVVAVVTVGFLGAGLLSAHLAGSNVAVGAARVVLGGWIELGATYGIGMAVAAAL